MNPAPEMFREAFAEAMDESNMAPSEAARAMAGGDCIECEEFHQRLVQHITQYLATREPELRAVYRFDPTFASGEDARVRMLPSESSMIDLLVWTGDKRDTLAQEVELLQQGFAEERLSWLCPKALEWCHALNIVVVDDAEVEQHHGYAALINSLWVRPTVVWSKEK